MGELLDLTEELNGIIYDEEWVNNFYYNFIYSTDSNSECIEFHIDNSRVDVFYDDMDREWDDDNDDYKYTPKEEIINNLNDFQNRLNKIIEKLKKSVDK